MNQKEDALNENLKKLNTEIKKRTKEKKELEDKSADLERRISEMNKTVQNNQVTPFSMKLMVSMSDYDRIFLCSWMHEPMQSNPERWR